MAATTSSMATATTGLLPRLPTNQLSPFLALPCVPSRSSVHSLRISLESSRLSSFQVKASSTDETSTSELIDDLKEKWDKVENKSTVLLYGGGAILAVWLSSVLVGAINSVPLLPKIMELVGLGYTGWFVYRYLLFKTMQVGAIVLLVCDVDQSSRKELAEDIESLKKKIAGTE